MRMPALAVYGNKAFDPIIIGLKQLEKSPPRLDSSVNAGKGQLAKGLYCGAEQEYKAGQVVTLQRLHLNVSRCAGFVVEVTG